MKKSYKRLSKGWKLALDLLLLGLLLAALWLAFGCPLFSQRAAFRRAMKEAGLQPVELEFTTGSRTVGTDEKNAYSVSLWDRSGGSSELRIDPAVDGVYFVPLRGGPNWIPDYGVRDLSGFGHVIAVKADCAQTELTLVLEDYGSPDEEEYYPGGSYPMVLTEEQEGWRFYDFDDSAIKGTETQMTEALWGYFYWCQYYYIDGIPSNWPAELVLTAMDENSAVLRTVSCRLEP